MINIDRYAHLCSFVSLSRYHCMAVHQKSFWCDFLILHHIPHDLSTRPKHPMHSMFLLHLKINTRVKVGGINYSFLVEYY